MRPVYKEIAKPRSSPRKNGFRSIERAGWVAEKKATLLALLHKIALNMKNEDNERAVSTYGQFTAIRRPLVACRH
jgi:hypothetical protein